MQHSISTSRRRTSLFAAGIVLAAVVGLSAVPGAAASASAPGVVAEFVPLAPQGPIGAPAKTAGLEEPSVSEGFVPGTTIATSRPVDCSGINPWP